MVAGGNIWLNPHSANHGNVKKKKNIYEKTQTPGCSLIYFPSFTSIPGIL